MLGGSPVSRILRIRDRRGTRPEARDPRPALPGTSSRGAGMVGARPRFGFFSGSRVFERDSVEAPCFLHVSFWEDVRYESTESWT